jgi:hypothetical protein
VQQPIPSQKIMTCAGENNYSSLKSPSKRIRRNSDPANFLHQPVSSLKKNLNFFFGFSDPANFLHQPDCYRSLKKNLKNFFGFSDPANFLHQPATAPSKRILNFFLGFRSRQFSASASYPLKKNPANIMGFQIPPTICWILSGL